MGLNNHGWTESMDGFLDAAGTRNGSPPSNQSRGLPGSPCQGCPHTWTSKWAVSQRYRSGIYG